MFDGNTLLNGYPRPLTDLGIDKSVKNIDAAFVWGYNSKTYFFNGDMYWRFDEKSGQVDKDYPRRTNIWRQIPRKIDAAFVFEGKL